MVDRAEPLLTLVLVGAVIFVLFAPETTTSSTSEGTQNSITTSSSYSTSIPTPEQIPDFESVPESAPESAPESVPEPVPEPNPEPIEKKLVVIDAGHQSKGNSDKEPLGPGSTELKAKVTGGTQGRFTGLEEYRLNLIVAQKLQQILEARGYEVVMIRTTHDVDISNAERAQIANEIGADAFIRIHANGSDDSQKNGILTICQTKNNPYNAAIYDKSQLLSEMVLDETVESTGAQKLYVWETDTMSGINWCEVPVTIVEMGFMSNEEEDRKMATDAYQNLLAQGIANGIDRYFERIE